MRPKLPAYCAISLALLCAGLPAGTSAEEVEDGPVPSKNEVVMAPGMRITATTPTGTITVTAGQG